MHAYGSQDTSSFTATASATMDSTPGVNAEECHCSHYIVVGLHLAAMVDTHAHSKGMHAFVMAGC
jgi:hypothetical protein